jgi:hypothetical protein
MRIFKLASALGLVLALTAIAASSASAAAEFKPGAAKTPFTGKSGEATLQVKGGASIKCKASEVLKGEGELLGPKTALFIIHLTGCTSLGLAENSLGDSSGVVLAHYEVETCTISTKPLFGGLLLKLLPLHIEIPAASVLLLEEGSFVSGLSPENKATKEFALKIEQKEGKQTIDGCLNAEGTKVVPETLTTSENGKAAVASAEEAKSGTLLFETEETFVT